MCRIDTKLRVIFATVGFGLLGGASYAQEFEFKLNWRAIGSTVVSAGRAGMSGAPVSGVWFSADGASLETELGNGRVFRTLDFETWTAEPRAGSRVSAAAKIVDSLPEAGATAVAVLGNPYRAYAYGRFLWRSDDGGRHWTNVIANGNSRLIGEAVRAVAVSPVDGDRIAAVTDEGVWLSSDGGQAWVGLNAGLPNLRLRRLYAAPRGGRGLLAEWGNGQTVEWLPGTRGAWLAGVPVAAKRDNLRWAAAGKPESRLEVRAGERSRIYRSLDGGVRWDEMTSDLPANQITGIAADRASGAIYLATERGVYYTLNSLEVASAPTSWIRLGGNLPKEAALDVLLDEGGNFLYTSLASEGVFLTYAPHRRRSPATVSAANLETRAAAPGALMSVIGMRLTQAQIAGKTVPILSATQDETQVQIPYDATVPSPPLELSGEGSAVRMDLEMAETAPVIFTDRDGAPLILDAESGELIDPATPLRSGMRIQILLSGLGRVEPAWPAGVAAPKANSPRVVAAVRVWLDGKTLEVSKAELAGGYVGFYAVETRMPPVLDTTVLSLMVEAAGRLSNTILVRTSLD